MTVFDGELIPVAAEDEETVGFQVAVGKNREFLETQEKVKDLEMELEKVSGRLKESESQNTMLKEEVLVTKESCEEVELNQKQLQEQIADAEVRCASLLAAKGEFEAKVKTHESELALMHEKFSKICEEKNILNARIAQVEYDYIKQEMRNSELEEELRTYHDKASRFETALEAAVEKEKELSECLRNSTLRLAESDVLVEGLRNELNDTLQKLERVESDLTADVMKLSLVCDEKEATVQQLASRISETDLRVEEAFQKLSRKELEAEDLSEKLCTLRDLVKRYEEQALEASSLSESQKLELERTITSWRDQERITEEMRIRCDTLEEERKSLLAEKLDLSGKVSSYELKLTDLETKSLTAISDKSEEVEGMKRVIEDLSKELTSERENIQMQRSSALEENKSLRETYKEFENELLGRIADLEEQLKDHESSKGELQSQVEILTADLSLKSELQNFVKELEEQLAKSKAQIQKEKESESQMEMDREAAYKELQIKSNAVEVLESKVKELEQKLQLEEAQFKDKLSSALEENKALLETYKDSDNELRGRIADLEEQLKDHKSSKDDLQSQIKILTADVSEKSELQNLVKELEEQLANSKAQVQEELKETISQKEMEREAAFEELQLMKSAAEVLESKVKKLEQKLQLEEAQSKEKDHQLEVKLRDFGSVASPGANEKSSMKSSGQEVLSDSQIQAGAVNDVIAPYPVKALKHIFGVALVSVITGVFLGKRY
ncbi:unnamed protein product [Cuscuta campestris]|uniref:Uncharacterized protein n=1 Tax=Cuscuta campestris TaxID=132261 RepID=A0A484MVZ8_9ASTE|nr:unnamed protein product [Cuscuta campestris]